MNNRRNLAVMILLSVIQSINYNVVNYIAVTFSKPQMVIIFQSIAEILAYLTSGILYSYLGVRKSFLISMVLSSASGFLAFIPGDND